MLEVLNEMSERERRDLKRADESAQARVNIWAKPAD
jgi:hypothetical protein